MKTKILITLLVLSFFTGCATLSERLVQETSEGEIIPNQETIESIGVLGTAAQSLGVPYAGLAGDFAALVATGTALFIEAKRRKEKQTFEAEKQSSKLDNPSYITKT